MTDTPRRSESQLEHSTDSQSGTSNTTSRVLQTVRGNVVLLCGCAVAALAFLVFAWPTSYLIVRDSKGQVYRVNRFTGVRQEATAKGWRTKEQLESEYWTKQAQEQAVKEQKENEEKAARQKQLDQIVGDLKLIRVSNNRSELDRIILSNPSSWDLGGAYNNTTVEYYVRVNGTEEFLTKQETTNNFMKAHSMNDFKLRDVMSDLPYEISSLQSGNAFTEKIFIQFDTATNRDTGEQVKLKPSFVWKHTRTWKVPSSE